MIKPVPLIDTDVTLAERQRRIAREAAGIAEADADIAASRLIDEAEIDAWSTASARTTNCRRRAPAVDPAAVCRDDCAIPRRPVTTWTRGGVG